MTVPPWVPLEQVSLLDRTSNSLHLELVLGLLASPPKGTHQRPRTNSGWRELEALSIWQTQGSFLEEASSSNPRRDRVAKNGLRRGSRIRQGPEVRRGNDCFI